MKSTSRPLKTENSMSFVSPSSWIPAGSAEPRLPEVDRFASTPLQAANDEVVFIDERSELKPSQAVENRLVALLREASLPVSHLQMRGLIRGRCDD
jgi:hypothetical protein